MPIFEAMIIGKVKTKHLTKKKHIKKLLLFKNKDFLDVLIIQLFPFG